MAFIGGYQLIDFQNQNFTLGTGKTIAGVFNAIKNANGKRVIISNINIAGTQYNDVEVSPVLNSTYYAFKVYEHPVTVYNTDEITITSATINNVSELTASTATTAEIATAVNSIIEGLIDAGLMDSAN